MAKKKKAKKKVKSKAKSKAKPKAKAKVKAKAKPKAKKATAKKKKSAPKSGEKPSKVIAPANSTFLGYVEDYFAKIGVIALTLESGLSLGNRIHIIGHTTNFDQVVSSMQTDHQPVVNAVVKQGVGIRVTARARKGDHVYLIP